jgi:hypothetical protein
MAEIFLEDNTLGYCVAELAEDGKPFQQWDGSTIYYPNINNIQNAGGPYSSGGQKLMHGYGCPSKFPDRYVRVYGDGSLYCLELTSAEIHALRWAARDIQFYENSNFQVYVDLKCKFANNFAGEVLVPEKYTIPPKNEDEKPRTGVKYMPQKFSVDFNTQNINFNKTINLDNNFYQIYSPPGGSYFDFASILYQGTYFYDYYSYFTSYGGYGGAFNDQLTYYQFNNYKLQGAISIIEYGNRNKYLGLSPILYSEMKNTDFLQNYYNNIVNKKSHAYIYEIPFTYKRMIAAEVETELQYPGYAGIDKNGKIGKVIEDKTNGQFPVIKTLSVYDIDNKENLLQCDSYNRFLSDIQIDYFKLNNSEEKYPYTQYAAVFYKNYVLTLDNNNGFVYDKRLTAVPVPSKSQSYVNADYAGRWSLGYMLLNSTDPEKLVDYTGVTKKTAIANGLKTVNFDSGYNRSNSRAIANVVASNQIGINFNSLLNNDSIICVYDENGNKKYWVNIGNASHRVDYTISIGDVDSNFDTIWGSPKNFVNTNKSQSEYAKYQPKWDSPDKTSSIFGNFLYYDNAKGDYALSVPRGSHTSVLTGIGINLYGVNDRGYLNNSNFNTVNYINLSNQVSTESAALYYRMLLAKKSKEDFYIIKQPIEIELQKNNVKKFNSFVLQEYFAQPGGKASIPAWSYNSGDFVQISGTKQLYQKLTDDVITNHFDLDFNMSISQMPTLKYKVTRWLTYDDNDGNSTYDEDTGAVLI